MKDTIPACTLCETNKYVQRDHTAERIGTATGGALGALVACLGGAASIAACSLAPGSGSTLGAAAGSATRLLLGFLSGSATGNLVGECIDAKIRMQYRCNQCGRIFNG